MPVIETKQFNATKIQKAYLLALKLYSLIDSILPDYNSVLSCAITGNNEL